ncbi:MAG TPA: LysR substrate-binding domain-containing protein, partial [Nitrospira sp.]|nr:LysR substrate-binding domain-containing protein [Nitrospira sp.]
CVLPREHPLASRDAIDVRELSDDEIITYAPHTAIGMAVGEAFRISGIDIRKRIQVNYSMTAFVLASRGAGIALVEPLMLASAQLPMLVARPLRPRIDVKTMLLYPRSRAPSRTVSDFMNVLKEEVSWELSTTTD